MRTFLAILILAFSSTLALAGANPNGVAVIIGNRGYQGDIPAVDFAHRDAEAIKQYVIRVLGFDKENVIDLRDASKAQIEGTFGNDRNHKGKLWRYANPDGKSDILIFYSGHGVPGQNDGKGYLLPSDSSPDDVEINGYPLSSLYRNLGKIAARSKTILLDACFSGLSPKGALIKSASPIFIRPEKVRLSKGMAVLAAAGPSQLASWDEDARHGLFTEFFLRGAYGEADQNKNGRVSLEEIKSYLDQTMTKEARRRYGREQNASLAGEGSLLLAAYGSGGRPVRPEITEEMVKQAALPAVKVIQQQAQKPSQSPVTGPSRMAAASIARFKGDWDFKTDSNSSDCPIQTGGRATVVDGRFRTQVSHPRDPNQQDIEGSFDETGRITGFVKGPHVSVEMEGQAKELQAIGIYKIRGDVNCNVPWVARKSGY